MFFPRPPALRARGAIAALVATFLATACSVEKPVPRGRVELAQPTAVQGSGPAVRSRASNPDSPNIVLLILDTLRADRLGAYADAAPEGVSPELDALAAQGVRFARAISQSSWTRPSIGSILTSRYPRDLGIYQERGDALAPRFTTLAETLEAAGYRTLGLTANPNINRAFNFHQGFDEYVDSWVVWQWMRPEPGQRSERGASLPSAPELFERAFEMVGRAPSVPTYLQLDLMEIHEYVRSSPMIRPEYRGLYRNRFDARYLQSLRQLSFDVGEFVARLAQLPGWNDAIFVVTSDHGEGLDSHPHVAGSRSHGTVLYDSQNWVPLVLFSPGDALPRGRVVDRPVRMLDVMPTLLDYAGVQLPEGLEGTSLRPLVDAPDAPIPLPDYFVVETQFRGADKIGVYAADVKLIHNVVPQRGTAVFELQPNHIDEDGTFTDVGEAFPTRRDELRVFLSGWIDEHPRSSAWRGDVGPSDHEIEQLRAIGYVH